MQLITINEEELYFKGGRMHTIILKEYELYKIEKVDSTVLCYRPLFRIILFYFQH